MTPEKTNTAKQEIIQEKIVNSIVLENFKIIKSNTRSLVHTQPRDVLRWKDIRKGTLSEKEMSDTNTFCHLCSTKEVLSKL